MSAEPIFGSTYASDSASAQASQNTFISSGQVLQGTGSCESSASIVPGSPSDTVDGNDSSTLSVTFSDSTANTLVLTGNLTGSSQYHEGSLGVITGDVELSSSGSTGDLYQIFNGNEASFNTPGLDSWSIPISFTALSRAGADLYIVRERRHRLERKRYFTVRYLIGRFQFHRVRSRTGISGLISRGMPTAAQKAQNFVEIDRDFRNIIAHRLPLPRCRSTSLCAFVPLPSKCCAFA